MFRDPEISVRHGDLILSNVAGDTLLGTSLGCRAAQDVKI